MDRCPKCGRPLIEKKGIFGKFLACPAFPDCRYTTSSPAHCPKCNDTGFLGPDETETYQDLIPCDCQEGKKQPYCKKCDHTGYLPFIKSDHIVPNVFINCECRDSDYRRSVLHPEDFDFPISYDFHRSLCVEHGWIDPGSCYPPEVEQAATLVSAEPSNVQQQVDKLRVALADERNKINEHLDKKPKKGRDYV